MTLVLQPISQRAAKAFITLHHRHHPAPRGMLFALGLSDGKRIVGVAIVGRPTARLSQDGWTAEVTRVCTIEGAPMGAASKLYSKAKHAAQALGYVRVHTYLLASEAGTSLKAAGWRFIRMTKGGSWSRPSRQRVDRHPTDPKQFWVAA